jgi:hypothetical protein
MCTVITINLIVSAEHKRTYVTALVILFVYRMRHSFRILEVLRHYNARGAWRRPALWPEVRPSIEM